MDRIKAFNTIAAQAGRGELAEVGGLPADGGQVGSADPSQRHNHPCVHDS